MSTKKMFSNVIIALSLIISISYFSSCSKGAIVDKLVEKMATEVNKQCPMAVDSETRLDSVTHPAQHTLAYFYTLLNIEKDSLTFDQKVLDENLTQAVKANKQLEALRKLNVSFRYVYFDKNSDPAFKIEITPEMYNK
ncbi:MAG: hypothetical protein FWD60_00280 [Candidatus Azobacteroides sp.]|nr:hypothetical protein [Candidatus Azobacteroides sp.]